MENAERERERERDGWIDNIYYAPELDAPLTDTP